MKRILAIVAALSLCAGAGIAQAEVTGLDQRYGLAMIRVKGNGLEPVIQKCSDLEKEGVLPLGEHLRDVSECVTIVANESAPSEVSSGEESKRWLAQEMNNSQQGRLLRFPFVSYPKYAERAQARPAVVPVAARMPATARAVENSEAERNRAGWFKAEEETVRRGALILEGAKKRIALERKMRRLREIDRKLSEKLKAESARANRAEVEKDVIVRNLKTVTDERDNLRTQATILNVRVRNLQWKNWLLVGIGVLLLLLVAAVAAALTFASRRSRGEAPDDYIKRIDELQEEIRQKDRELERLQAANRIGQVDKYFLEEDPDVRASFRVLAVMKKCLGCESEDIIEGNERRHLYNSHRPHAPSPN